MTATAMNTKPAAFQATYSDWKLIRSRKVVQIVLEVPVERAGHAYDVLGGMPNPAAETWCAVARLDAQRPTEDTTAAATAHAQQPAPKAQPTPSPARALRNHAQQAGIMCSRPTFWKFAQERGHPEVVDSETAADYVRMYCGVNSRSEIKNGTRAEQRWFLMVSAFDVWQRAPQCGVVA